MDEFIKAAILQAKLGLSEGGIPIGAALVRDGRILGRGRNKRVQESNPVSHAETDCLRDAGRLGDYRGATLYSTLMPCYFCAGAVVQFGIRKVVAGESKTFAGARPFLEQHGVEVVDLDLAECKDLLGDFVRRHPKLWDEDIGRL